MRPNEQQQDVTPMSEEESVVRVIGRVKWYDAAKGYGFVVPEEADDASGVSGDIAACLCHA